MTLEDEIQRLRKHVGSHDKRAARLGTSRVTVIRWEQGTIPKPPYEKKLVAAGIPAHLFREARDARRRPLKTDDAIQKIQDQLTRKERRLAVLEGRAAKTFVTREELQVTTATLLEAIARAPRPDNQASPGESTGAARSAEQ